jgi:phosphatidylinositol-3-phosphatase
MDMGVDRSIASLAISALLVTVVAACGGNTLPEPRPLGQASPSPTASSSPSPTASRSPSPSPSPGVIPHVFVIVMENAGLNRALQSRPIARLASANTLLTNYYGVARPSLPNYLAMTSGSTWGITDNGYHVLPTTDLGTQLTTAGISWRAYMEGLTDAGCLRSPYPYALKHNPFAYYGGKCPPNVVPMEALDVDLAGVTPSFLFIKPGLCNDGHDCALDVAGAWLEATVTRIVMSEAWRAGGIMFVLWEEGEAGDNNLVPLIIISKDSPARRVETRYDHYSLLATIEDLFGLPRLGAAATAQPLTPLFVPGR